MLTDEERMTICDLVTKHVVPKFGNLVPRLHPESDGNYSLVLKRAGGLSPRQRPSRFSSINCGILWRLASFLKVCCVALRMISIDWKSSSLVQLAFEVFHDKKDRFGSGFAVNDS